MSFRGVIIVVAAGIVTTACGDRGARGTDDVEALEARALAHRTKGDFDRAIATYDSAILVDSERASTFNSRGVTFQLKNDYRKAVENYNDALRLQPEMAVAMKNRGRANFYLGNFAESARDLSAGLARDTVNAFVSVWLHMVRQRLGKADTTELARNIARTDRTRWPAPVAALYLGRVTPAQFSDSLTTGDADARALKHCGGAFYFGEYLLWNGRVDDAKARLEEAAKVCPHDYSEYQGAVAELGRLAATSAR
jgi:lipoprotein NlpI